ncbi:hypothetical protein OESDEN_01428 [Oesophagostomum dentatum]|uniref:Amino acid permease n=1 Tax=Oesophagostomum dentatum TaxID=61180 RepID=A0A0B1TRZ3_OESDE|nr:hypothetical protein OESDEN_01428 [Oesophagostomum dentatum]
MSKEEKNKIGLIGATSYIVGSIIGSGIFVSPKGILEHAGSVGLSLIIWVVSAVMAMLTAVNYIELGTSIPESGAEFAYITFMGWHPIAFSFLWLSTIIQGSCSGAVLFLTFGEYIVEAVNPLTCLDDSSRQTATRLFGFGLVLLLTLVNMFALNRFAARLQILSMVAKIAALVMIIGIGAFYMAFRGKNKSCSRKLVRVVSPFFVLSGDTQHFRSDYVFSGSKWSASQIVLAIYQGSWAYGGYTTLNYGTEEIEIKNFKKWVIVRCRSPRV